MLSSLHIRLSERRETESDTQGSERQEPEYSWLETFKFKQEFIKKKKKKSWKLTLAIKTNEVLKLVGQNISHAWKRKEMWQLTILALKKKQQIFTFPTFPKLRLSDAACSFMTPDSENCP